jgi:hypothetical protein
MTFKVRFESVSQHVMLLADVITFKVRCESTCHVLADLMTFKVRFESVSQHVMLLADLMTFKVRSESVGGRLHTGASQEKRKEASSIL